MRQPPGACEPCRNPVGMPPDYRDSGIPWPEVVEWRQPDPDPPAMGRMNYGAPR